MYGNFNDQVPGAVVLDAFGFNALGYWADVAHLGISIGAFLLFGFLWLQFFVREKR